jgi:hypothetical protein
MIVGIGFVYAALASGAPATTADVSQHTLTITPFFEDRERFERRLNKGFSTKVADNASDLFTRARPGINFSYNKITGQVVYQFSHDWDWNHTKNSSTDNSDLLLGYVSVPNGDGTDIVGRQRLILGSGRILGENNWSNNSTTWDAIRLKSGDYNLFGGKLATNSKESEDARITGGSAETKFGTTLITFQHDQQIRTQLDIYTVDQYYHHAYAGLDFAGEAAAELGKVGIKNLQAAGGWARVTKAFNPKLSFSVEGDIATGGGSANRTNTFTNYYGDHHAWDGTEDYQGWSNVKELNASFNYKWSSTVNSMLKWLDFGLYDPTGGWISKSDTVNKSGSTSLIDPTGGKGSNVGQEIDFETSWALKKNATLSAGLSDFLPGNYLKAFTGSSFSKESYWFWAQLNFKFGG